MHGKAREASELHQKFIELVTLQKEEIKKLKIYETKHDDATSKLLEQEPLLKDKNINSKELDHMIVEFRISKRHCGRDVVKCTSCAERLEDWMPG